MEFVLSKTLLFLILPPSGILVLMAAGMLLGRRHQSTGRALVALGTITLYLFSISSVADMLIRPLESFSRPYSGTKDRVDAVVVLGGGVYDLSWVPAPPAPSGTSLERLAAAIEIARSLKVPLVISGASGEIAGNGPKEAHAMADAAVRLGFPRKAIVIEDRSRNTLENAEAVGKLITGRTIVLVTSAFHMKRASGMFRKLGFTVIPAPTGYHSETRPSSWTGLIPHADNLATSSTAISERISLSWYAMQKKV
jgi:uncharacterized SAM-binding protein YcdF (DUF218 family)